MTSAPKKTTTKTRSRRASTVEIHPDAQRRFEKAVDIALRTKAVHKPKKVSPRE